MTSDRTIRTLCAALCVGLTAAAAAVWGATPAAAPNPNETCMMCHADPSAKGAGGKPVAVDAAKFAASVHGEMQFQCTSCHTDVSADKVPHAEKLKPVECASCHEKPVKEYTGTVHGKARSQGNTVAAKCTDCHGTHDIRRSKYPASRTNHANLEATCAACHGNAALIENAHLPGGNIASQYHDSIHGRALQSSAARKAAAPTCTDCHGAHSIRTKTDPESRVTRARIPDTCGSCHQQVRATYEKSQHGKLRHDGNLGAPGCTDCHSAHRIERHDLPKWQADVINECGNCHQSYITTYRDTFHGQVTALGYTRVATCASCHGAHEMLPASNPASTVSAENRLSTCQKCHAGAKANFAMFDPHANKHDRERNPLYYYASKFMDWLLIGVFAFFGIHTVFWFARSLREVQARRRQRAAGGDAGEGR